MNNKKCFTDSSSSFEFPRQSQDHHNNKPEVMQFKASQKLVDPNQHQQSRNQPQQSNKKGLNPTVVQDLRNQFRIRSAAKNQQQLQQQQPSCSRGSKPSRLSHARRKASKQVTTSREKTVYIPHDDATSKYQSPQLRGSADKINGNEEDPPTDFEKIPNAKPAVFGREWHKFSIPLNQLPVAAGAKKRSQSSHRKKLSSSKIPQRRRSAGAIVGANPTTSKEGRKIKIDPLATSSKKKKSSGRKRGTSIGKKETRKSPAQLASQFKEMKGAEVSKKSKEKLKLSNESVESPPLLSLNEEDDDKEISTKTAKLEPKHFLIKEEDFPLKPVTEKVALKPLKMPSQTCSAPAFSPPPTATNEEEFSAVGQEDMFEKAPPKIVETDHCGNSNFPVVVAAGKIIDYCDEKDLFKDFVDPADLPTFNSFLAGEVKSMSDLLTILENLMDQIVDSKKLSETEAIAKDWNLVAKDRNEGRNYLLDCFLSKKAKLNVSEQVLSAKKPSSITPPSHSSPSISQTSSTSQGEASHDAHSPSCDVTQTFPDPEEKKN